MGPFPQAPWVAGVEGLVVAGFALTLGWLIVHALLPACRHDPILNWALAFAGFAMYVAALMLIHIGTGGAVLSRPWLVRGITLAIGVTFAVLRVRQRAGSAKRSNERTQGRRAAGAAVGCCALGLLIWYSPAMALLPLPPGQDMTNHAGWASQLMNGEATPSATITGQIPNFYPWLFHSMLAFLARFTPGGRALHALAPLQGLQIVGVLCPLFALGTTIGRRTLTGAAAALFGALTGGIGFVMLRGIDIVTKPRKEGLRYLGDLLYKRSYNASFYNVAPPFPRDVAFALLLAFLVLALLGITRRSPRTLVCAGIVLGLSGLAGAESFLLGVGVSLIWVVFPFGMRRRMLALWVFGPALATYSLWLVPQIINYVGLGGYRNLTVIGPVSLPFWAILASWGIVTPLAASGLVLHLRARQDLRLWFPLSVLVAAAIIISATSVPAALGEGFSSLARAHRYWPLLYLGLSLYAALGITELADRLGPLRPRLATAVGVVLILAAIASPALGSFALARDYNVNDSIFDATRGKQGSVLNAVSPRTTGLCTAAAPSSIQGPLFAYTGYRMVMNSADNPHGEDFARIRWQNIYQHLEPRANRVADNSALVRGEAVSTRLGAIVRKYGVDVIVSAANWERIPRLVKETTYPTDWPFPVLRLSDCGAHQS